MFDRIANEIDFNFTSLTILIITEIIFYQIFQMIKKILHTNVIYSNKYSHRQKLLKTNNSRTNYFICYQKRSKY